MGISNKAISFPQQRPVVQDAHMGLWRDNGINDTVVVTLFASIGPEAKQRCNLLSFIIILCLLISTPSHHHTITSVFDSPIQDEIWNVLAKGFFHYVMQHHTAIVTSRAHTPCDYHSLCGPYAYMVDVVTCTMDASHTAVINRLSRCLTLYPPVTIIIFH